MKVLSQAVLGFFSKASKDFLEFFKNYFCGWNPKGQNQDLIETVLVKDHRNVLAI